MDECVDQRLRFLFSEHQCETAAYAKLSGLKNGALLDAAETAGFEMILTTDQEIPYQQNLALRNISVVVLCAPTNRLADLRKLVPAVIEAISSITPGHVIRIG